MAGRLHTDVCAWRRPSPLPTGQDPSCQQAAGIPVRPGLRSLIGAHAGMFISVCLYLDEDSIISVDDVSVIPVSRARSGSLYRTVPGEADNTSPWQHRQKSQILRSILSGRYTCCGCVSPSRLTVVGRERVQGVKHSTQGFERGWCVRSPDLARELGLVL
ncbi:hypothetical protein ElyMa_000199600 [Elysia marginata]|uniref:Uncharacterized protein n=1 Tax=Elysia marginata TaxID=1093978 RepID=A0AAV4EWH4_9GAST|nr:hypothetical protein ElyMa_000199600 [Elysia marginata]